MVQVGDERYLLPWDRGAGWLCNVRANPDVVLDDRTRVHRARAEVVEGAEAERVRQEFIQRYLPGPLRGPADRSGSPLGPGLPAVRLVTST
jgi:hypothetical protein